MSDKRYFLINMILLMLGCAFVTTGGSLKIRSDSDPQVFFESKIDSAISENIWSDIKELALIGKEMPRPLLRYSHQYLVAPGPGHPRVVAFTMDESLILVFRDGLDLCPYNEDEKCGVNFYESIGHEFLHAAFLKKGIPASLHHCMMIQDYYLQGIQKVLKKYFTEPPRVKPINCENKKNN